METVSSAQFLQPPGRKEVFWPANRHGVLLATTGSVPPPYDIRARTFAFSKSVVLFCRTFRGGDYVMTRLAGQLARAAGSVGANLEEAADAQSKPDFVSKNAIALKECREARYWLRLIAATEPRTIWATQSLIREADELTAILRTIILNAKKNGDRGRARPADRR